MQVYFDYKPTKSLVALELACINGGMSVVVPPDVLLIPIQKLHKHGKDQPLPALFLLEAPAPAPLPLLTSLYFFGTVQVNTSTGVLVLRSSLPYG